MRGERQASEAEMFKEQDHWEAGVRCGEEGTWQGPEPAVLAHLPQDKGEAWAAALRFRSGAPSASRLPVAGVGFAVCLLPEDS